MDQAPTAGNSEEQPRGPSDPSGRRGYLRVLGVAAIASAGAGAVWAAASKVAGRQGAIEPNALLLTPQDFPDTSFTEIRRPGGRTTKDGGQAAQVVLEGDSLRLFQSVVVFPNEGAAQQALQTLRYGEAGQAGGLVDNSLRYGEESLILTGRQGDEGAVSIVFRRRRVFVRLTLTGTNDVRTISRYAQQADNKVKEWQA